MLTVLLSRLLGLLRDRFLAAAFFNQHTSWQLDVYFAAFRLPDMIFQLLAVGAFSAALIPVFSQYLVKAKTEAWHVASSVITIGLSLFILLGGLLVIFVAPLNRLIAPGFSAAQLQLMNDLTRILVIAQASFLVSNFFTGILQSYQYFLVPAFSPIAYNLGIIFGIVCLGPALGIYGPALGVVLGAVLHLLVQLPLVKALGYHYRISFDWHHPGVRRIGRLMLPRTLALAVGQIELTLAVFLATSLSAGSLAIFYFAQNLNSVAVGLFGASIGQAILPVLSREAGQTGSKFSRLLINALNQTLYLSLPAGMFLLILRIPAVRLAFGAPNFPWAATLLTGKVVAILAVSVFAQCAIQVLVRGFYSLSNTRTPLYISIWSVALNVLLSLLFIYQLRLGVPGLALAVSLSSFFQTGLLGYYLYRLSGGWPLMLLVAPFTKMAAATLITGFSLWLPLRFLDRYILNTDRTLDLIILTLVTGLIGLAVYLGLSKLLQIRELNDFVKLFRRLTRFEPLIEEPIP